MTNPLLTIEQFPDYTEIQPHHAQPAIEELCHSAQKQIETLLKSSPANWETYEKLEIIGDKISKAWSPISHMHSVMNSDNWREAYADCQPIIAQYGAIMSQHTGLYNFYRQLRESNDFNNLNDAQQKLINDEIRDFELSGVNLSDDKKAEYQRLVQSASELYTTFSNNVLDATQAFHINITDSEQLAGIPESALALYRQLAEQNEVTGYWITLDYPSYVPALTYAENQELREKLYHAFNTRASELGPHGGQFDNTPIVEAILSVRADIADLLGFTHYAELSLANKMASSAQHVIQFLDDLVEKSRPQAIQEYETLKIFAQEKLGIDQLNPWDVAFVSEKLKAAEYAFSDEEVRPYFPVPKVMDGLFDIVEKLFNVSFEKNTELSIWHKDVSAYTVIENGEPIAYFYFDLYARQDKNGGAWMNGAIDKIENQQYQQKPIAYLVCNFIPPTDGQNAYLSHNEITTLFHEFGHGLHHMLTTIGTSAQSGINGVEWDAVELPSQFMENFCFEKEVLIGMSEHKDNNKSLPHDLYSKLIAAKNFQSAMVMVRQLEFSLFDIKLHTTDGSTTAMDCLKAVRDYVSVTPASEYSRFPMAFSHVFAGGYAAGYFSYKWAEVLSADAFSRFEEEGVYNKNTGILFKQEMLQRGSSRTAMANFVAFRGREPTIDALLSHNGIKS